MATLNVGVLVTKPLIYASMSERGWGSPYTSYLVYLTARLRSVLLQSTLSTADRVKREKKSRDVFTFLPPRKHLIFPSEHIHQDRRDPGITHSAKLPTDRPTGPPAIQTHHPRHQYHHSDYS